MNLKPFIFLLANLCLSYGYAQVLQHPKAFEPSQINIVPLLDQSFTGFERHQYESILKVPPAENQLLDLVGTTVYDLQSNNGVGHRVYNDGNGNITAVYNFSLNPTGYADRGTGYNKLENGVWGADPTSRIESVRTGSTNLAVAPDGTEYVFAHTNTYEINMSKRVLGGTWTDSQIPSGNPVVWARAAVGGTDGKTIHVIACTLPVSQGGTLYNGMDHIVLYYRSLDGGLTWDIQDMLMPGVEAEYFFYNDIEGYAVDANGENVSVFVTSSWNHSMLYVSHDNGNTWESRMVFESAVANYLPDLGYDTLSLPPDPYREVLGDPYAILGTDGSVDVLVDDQGITHCWYGTQYITDKFLNDGVTNVYTTNSSIRYFNTNLDDNMSIPVGYSPDLNNNQMLDLTGNVSRYRGVAMNTFPSGSIDAAGNLYLTYCGVNELYTLNAVLEWQARQPFIIGSKDGGLSWTDPQVVLDPTLLGADSLEIPNWEAVFNSTAKLADDKVHIVFQVDKSPLTNVSASSIDKDPLDNTIRYLGFPTAWVLSSATNKIEKNNVDLLVYPNPASSELVVLFTAEGKQASRVEIYDMYGRKIQERIYASNTTERKNVRVPVNNLANGVYQLCVYDGNALATQKVIISH